MSVTPVTPVAPVPTSDLYDEHGEALAICTTPFRQFGARRMFAGPVRTLTCHEDNALLRELVNTPGGGAVRDSVALGGLDLGTKALGTVPRKSGKTGAGTVDGAVTIGGVTFRPGDTVHADDDGTVVLPAA
ncbi:RraA family protein [Streptomyces vinaceus]|uniref:RraA family protein n=1 Tax=Streptomyces vinaceus TaxID=1960 RepID=UPI003821DC3D